MGFVVGGDVVAVCVGLVEDHLGVGKLILEDGVISGEIYELSCFAISVWVVEDRGDCVELEELVLIS